MVASFGNISASGGVYIGVAAEKIVSNPGSITGSIGVILRGNNLSPAGAHRDPASKPSRAVPTRTSCPRSCPQCRRAAAAAGTDRQQLRPVRLGRGEGRGLSPDTVRRFADGRVFSGAQAKELGWWMNWAMKNRPAPSRPNWQSLDEELQTHHPRPRERKICWPSLPIVPLSRALQEAQDRAGTSGQALWLHRP